ncbi:hypothetical protein [Nocardia australiensis]|uniref:hypothetical protein n=1 Tax=Nocardia australiensis TaxID=2887191 RepID=UPI001D14A915|nr:hypothetical protein [Nocardia australiensis]
MFTRPVDSVSLGTVPRRTCGSRQRGAPTFMFITDHPGWLSTDDGIDYRAVSDYGLALSCGFDLSPTEAAFFDQNQSYDRGYTATYLVNWLLTALYGRRREDRETRAAMVRAIAEGKPPEGIPEEAAALLTRHAPIAAAMSAFTRAFQQKSRSTPYPDHEIRRLLDGQAIRSPDVR